MRAQELIANFLELVDRFDNPEPEVQVVTVEPTEEPGTMSPLSNVSDNDDDIRRFRQIVDLANGPGCKQYDTRPHEQYASIEAVTTDAGGGVNGPKHPSDLRVQHPSLYPGHQHKVGE